MNIDENLNDRPRPSDPPETDAPSAEPTEPEPGDHAGGGDIYTDPSSD